MRILVLVFFVWSSVYSVYSSEREQKVRYNGFSGGMLVHTGYIKGESFDIYGPQNLFIKEECVEGMVFGLGGRMGFHFNDQWRIGMEGYGTSVCYGENRYKIGWGGVNFEYLFHSYHRFSPFVGLTFGGGVAKNTIILEGVSSSDLFSTAVYRENAFLLLNPTVGVEYGLTEKLRLVFKADYMMNLTQKNEGFASGIRYYIGLVFARFQ